MSTQPFTPIEVVTDSLGIRSIHPTSQLITELRVHLEREGDDVESLARWIAERIEEVGAQNAQGTFDLEGNGPFCSWCGGFWGICEHARQTLAYNDEGVDLP